jgi:hypothetical protein
LFAKTTEKQMAWTEITREHYDRRHLRYASDCTDEEWALIEPFMPAPSKVGRPRKWPMREIWNAIQYMGSEQELFRILR